jgi:hypothetical protein
MTAANLTTALALGFKEIVLEEDAAHTADGQIRFFLGNYVMLTIEDMLCQQDPQFVMVFLA